MEVFDGNQGLVRSMEEDGYSDGGGAGIHRQNTRDHLLTRRDWRRRLCVSAVLCLLAAAALALLLTVALGGRARQSAGSQPINLSPGAYAGQQRLTGDKNPSAMLTVPNGNITDQDYLIWERDQGLAFCRGGFNYSNGKLIVPRKGTYRVFLQITYNSKEGIDCESELQLSNVIYLYSESYPEDRPLLSSCDTVSCSVEQWSKSLYTAGLFSLEANSELRVKSSHPHLIVRREHLVFFGAQLLP